ncbi:MAG: hypothetical protein K2K77_09355, partial [Duncaniella sp.]|nr:hypothetical protein [Duncaniella sp.]
MSDTTAGADTVRHDSLPDITSLLSRTPVVADTVSDTVSDIVSDTVSDTVADTVSDIVSDITDTSTDSILSDTLAAAPRSALRRHEMSVDSTRRPLLSRTRINPANTNDDRARIVRTKVDIDNPVDFSSRDSMIMTGRNMAYMYGDGKVVYGNIKLDAENIEMNLDSTTVYAFGSIDSVGDLKGNPIFDDNGTTYDAKTMRYNFKTEKGFITDVITQQGEGYLTGGQSKKIDENTIYIQDAKYTTCDDHEHPHFWMQLTKGKVRPGKDAVTGPAYMVLAGLPLPLAVPFGYFPFSEKYSSGIIFPTFGDDYNRGYYLSNGGYYLALSD